MLSADDFKQLKEIFVTKEDLKKQLSNHPTRDEFRSAIGELVDLIMNFQTSMEDRFDRQDAKLSMHSDILDNHEHRLDKLEDKVFSPS